MQITLKRIARRETYTIGKLYIDGVYFCDTCEDKDRGLNNKMSVDYIKKLKVWGKTAIPTGTYEIDINTVSPKYSSKQQYSFCKGKLPRLKNVPGFDGILIHIGNSANDSAGCILVGENKVVGMVVNSTKTFQNLYAKLLTAKDKIYITIL